MDTSEKREKDPEKQSGDKLDTAFGNTQAASDGKRIVFKYSEVYLKYRLSDVESCENRCLVC